MRTAILLLAVLCLSGATIHEDGSVTITKDEKDALTEYMSLQKLKIEMLERKLVEEPKPARCI